MPVLFVTRLEKLRKSHVYHHFALKQDDPIYIQSELLLWVSLLNFCKGVVN